MFVSPTAHRPGNQTALWESSWQPHPPPEVSPEEDTRQMRSCFGFASPALTITWMMSLSLWSSLPSSPQLSALPIFPPPSASLFQDIQPSCLLIIYAECCRHLSTPPGPCRHSLSKTQGDAGQGPPLSGLYLSSTPSTARFPHPALKQGVHR